MTDSQSNSAADILMHLIVALLAPMFLQAADGDIHFARAAAAETVNGYRARNYIDLLAIAQIIGFGLTTLSSLGLSMADDLSMSMTLRLRASAVASGRAGETCRRALARSRLDGEPPAINEADGPFFDAHAGAPQAPVQPTVAGLVGHRASDTQAGNTQQIDTRISTQQPFNTHASSEQTVDTQQTSPQQIGTPPADIQATDSHVTNVHITNTQSTDAQAPKPQAYPPAPHLQSGSATNMEQHRSMWANAMSDVAAEFTTSLPHLPPAERRAASVRAAALSSVARDLLTSNKTQPLPPFALPPK